MRVMLMGGPHGGGVVQRAYAPSHVLMRRDYLIEVGADRAPYRIVSVFDMPDGTHSAFAHEAGCGCDNAVCRRFIGVAARVGPTALAEGEPGPEHEHSIRIGNATYWTRHRHGRGASAYPDGHPHTDGEIRAWGGQDAATA